MSKSKKRKQPPLIRPDTVVRVDAGEFTAKQLGMNRAQRRAAQREIAKRINGTGTPQRLKKPTPPPPEPPPYTVDENGVKHYGMVAETGVLGVKGGE